MARRRTRNRMEARADFEAAERQKTSEDEDTEEEGEEEEDEDDESGDESGDESDELGEAGDVDDEEEIPVVKKKKKAAPKDPKPRKARTPKHVRQKVVWIVYDNSNKKIASYEYPKKQEAEEHAARLKEEKKMTFYVQPVKENIEEKKE
jgi:hypothetical protein